MTIRSTLLVGGARYRLKTALPRLTVAQLPSFASDGHRAKVDGSYPENTFETADAAVAMGVSMLDLDAIVTSDNVPIAIHDTTLNRTTTGTGTISTLTAAEVRSYRVNGGVGWSPSFGLLLIPTVAQMLDRYGDRVFFTIEAKSTSLIPILGALIRARNLTGSAYINSPNIADAAAIHAEGCLHHLYGSTTVTNVNDAAAAGVDLISLPFNAADTVFAAAAASTIPTIFATSVSRRSRMARALALNATQRVRGYISDAPAYVAQPLDTPAQFDSIASRLTDRRLGAGWLPVSSSESVPPFITTGGTLAFPATFRNAMLFGDMSTAKAPDSYRLRYRHRWTSEPTDTALAVQLRFGCPTDGQWAATGVSDDGGYNLVARYSGTVDLLFEPAGGGTTTNIATMSLGAVLGVGTFHAFTVAITPTAITVTHEASGRSMTAQHTGIRGGYVHVGKSGLTAGAAELDLLERLPAA